jgi:hypothetical protein
LVRGCYPIGQLRKFSAHFREKCPLRELIDQGTLI